MMGLFQSIGGLFFVAAVSALAADTGGMTAHFSPEEVLPGDLVVLSVEMHRDDFGQFVLEVPSHPLLHLVSREPIPPQFTFGRYHQEERLVLQALSSGPLTLSGIRAELTETGGTRIVEFPDLTLKVLPFETHDKKESPQPFPEPDRETNSRSDIIPLLVGILIGGGLLVFFIRRNKKGPKSLEANASPKTSPIGKLAKRDFESLLEKHGDALSPKLRSDLESFLYAPQHSGINPSDLKTRLRKELEE